MRKVRSLIGYAGGNLHKIREIDVGFGFDEDLTPYGEATRLNAFCVFLDCLGRDLKTRNIRDISLIDVLFNAAIFKKTTSQEIYESEETYSERWRQTKRLAEQKGVN